MEVARSMTALNSKWPSIGPDRGGDEPPNVSDRRSGGRPDPGHAARQADRIIEQTQTRSAGGRSRPCRPASGRALVPRPARHPADERAGVEIGSRPWAAGPAWAAVRPGSAVEGPAESGTRSRFRQSLWSLSWKRSSSRGDRMSPARRHGARRIWCSEPARPMASGPWRGRSIIRRRPGHRPGD
jgi:hypothetical protein